MTISVLPAEITVPFEEYSEDPPVTESIDTESITAVKKYRVNWLDRWTFFRDLAGRSVANADGSYTRIMPYSYPDAPWLYVKGISAVPLGASLKDADPAVWPHAVVQVTFGTVPWSFGPLDQQPGQEGVYRSESIELSGEMLQLPASAFRFASNANMKVTHNVGRIMPLANISVVQELCPYIPYDLISAHTGHVNSVDFYGAPPGTVMFQGCQTEAQYGIGDVFSSKLMNQRYTTKYAYRPVPWNDFMKPDGSGFDTLLDANGDPVYPSSDLNELFF